jgi:hypothetical protein
MREERRQYPRLKIRLPIELFRESSAVPLRGETCDISLGGCYVESLFPLEVGTPLELRIRVANTLVIAVGEVATCDRQVGNGIRFTNMLQEDMEALKLFIEDYEKDHFAPLNIPADDQHEVKANSELRPWPGWPSRI